MPVNIVPELLEWSEAENYPMDWSLGWMGDLVWLCVPSFRESIVDLATNCLQFAAEGDDPLRKILDIDLLGALSHEVGTPAMAENGDAYRRNEFLDFIRCAVTYVGPGGSGVRYKVHAFVLEWLMLPPHREALRGFDPELETYIIRVFGNEW